MAKKKAEDKRILKSFYMDPDAVAGLDRLSRRTRVSKSDYVREAISDLLKKYEWHRERLPDGQTVRHALKRKKAKS